MRRLKENAMLEAEITPAGEVLVEGQHVGSLEGFRFAPDPQADGPEAKALRSAAQKALAGEIAERAEKVATAANKDFILAGDGTLRWQGAAIARLAEGDDALRPRLILLADELLPTAGRERVQARIDLWLAAQAEALLKPLFDLRNAVALAPAARGLAFRLSELLRHHRPRDDRRRGARPRSGGPCRPARPRRALRCLSHLRAGAAQAGSERSARHLLVPEERRPRYARADRPAAARRLRPHQRPRRSRIPDRALPRRRLPAGRHARRPRRHSRAPCRSHPAADRLAPDGGIADAARRRHRRLRLHRHRRHDVPARLLGRGFRFRAHRARLSHGAPPGAAKAGRPGSTGGRRGHARRHRRSGRGTGSRRRRGARLHRRSCTSRAGRSRSARPHRRSCTTRAGARSHRRGSAG